MPFTSWNTIIPIVSMRSNTFIKINAFDKLMIFIIVDMLNTIFLLR